MGTARHLGLAIAALMAGSVAPAQSPPAQPDSTSQAQQPAPAIGQGPGYHDPRSPFKPIVARDGVVPWPLLASVTSRAEKDRVVPVFPQDVQALNNRRIRLEGFMMPLEPGEKQRHFLLSSVPFTCPFCVPAGPEGLVEVRSRTPVKYTLEPVLVEGRLAVLNSDPYGLFYRIVDAAPLPP